MNDPVHFLRESPLLLVNIQWRGVLRRGAIRMYGRIGKDKYSSGKAIIFIPLDEQPY